MLNKDKYQFKPLHETYKLVAFLLATGMMYPNPKNEKRRLFYLGCIFSSVIPAVVFFSHELYLCTINMETENFTEHIAIFIPVIFVYIKWLQTVYYRKELQMICDQINIDYEEYNQKNGKFQDVVAYEIAKTKIIVNFWCTSVISCVTIFLLIAASQMIYYSIFDEPKLVLIHDMRFWGLTEEKKFQSPYFQLLFGYEVYLLGILLQVFAGYGGIFLVSVSHLCLKLKICGYNMMHALDEPKDLCRIRCNIKNIVNEQRENFKYLLLVEKKFQVWLGNIFVLLMLQISLNLYQAYSMQGDIDPRFIVFGVGAIFHILLPCYISAKVTEAAMEVAQSAYFCGWELVPDTGIRRSLCIIIVRAQVPLEITAFKILTFNMELFVSILKTSYSVLTILRK